MNVCVYKCSNMLHAMDYLITILWICSITSVGSAKVSFFGASHIAMPLQEAKLSTNLRLRFRTHQENALLFLAAGRTDYCLIALDNGRIKLNLKINEYLTELWSPKKTVLNDLQWHDVALQRYETNVSMQIDEHLTRKTMPSQIAELNVHFGVFLGGLGDFSESYLSSVDNFRGCMSDVYYNNVNVLKRAKERTSHVTSVHVSWSCSPEFDANQHQGISFLDDNSYVMLAKPVVQTGERYLPSTNAWNLEFRTIESLGTMLYNSGHDYVALEMVDSKLRFLVGKGSNVVELVSDIDISDGKWHNVSIVYSPTLVELIVDDTVHSAAFANGSSTLLNLGEEYYVGGLGEQRRRRAALKGLRAVEQSFKGCIRNLMVDKHSVGFPHMKITQDVAVDCIWKYPCLEKAPCILSSTCEQYEHDEFICYCDQAYCLKADFTEHYKIFTRSDLPREAELLSIHPLQLLEGDSVFLSTNVIDVLIDYAKLGILEAGVVFNIVQSPKHGKVMINSLGAEEGLGNSSAIQSKYFSLIDLSTDKVKYIHNGGEHPTDHMTIDLQLISNSREPLPEFLLGKHRFALHANITPVNDPPMLSIMPNKILRLTQGIPKIIGSDLLLAEDPDSPPASLMYSIVPPTDAKSPAIHGIFEVFGKAAVTFTQEDINQGGVAYLINTQATDDTSFDIGFQVSDGMETSGRIYLPVSIMPLQLRMVNNTGLVLVHKSSALITPWNLSFISNSDDDNIDVKYTIIQQPQFGNVQKLRPVDASWITVDSFTSNQVLLGHVRYIHNTDIPQHDDFKFTASFGPIKTIKYDFRLTFTKLKIGIQNQNSLHVNGTKEKIISAENLFHQTTPLPTFSRNIIYTVIAPPKYGLIYVEGYPEYAKEMDSFTQQDIDKNLIHYRTHQTCYSSFIDVFEFMVTVPECEDIRGSINIIYNPPEELSQILSYQTREKVFVMEGGHALLSRKHFEVLFNKFNYLTMKLSFRPKNGFICNYDEKDSRATQIDVFTLENLLLGDVYYCHDDSETIHDSMHFLVLSNAATDFQYICEVLVEITLVNDNSPIRIDDQPFHVVKNASKILSRRDLLFEDPDVDSNSTHIIYQRVESTNFEFCSASSGMPLAQFTQEDIDQGRILLRHISDQEIGKATFTVTDGLFQVPGSLDILASDPFINISDKNASVVQEGKYILIKLSDLAIETNLNTDPDDIEYTVLSDPTYGVLKILRRKYNATILPRASNTTSIRNFTQLDVARERLVYWNTEVASMDKIRYRVTAKNISAEGEILIRIYPPAYWDLLQIRRNQTLYVEESTSVKISRDILEIVHPNISPGDITYLVTNSPQHGYLEIQSITSDDEYNCKVFDQSTINSEKMFYIQAGVNQSVDHFVFDVTNGITWLKGLILKIVIIPENMYIQTAQNLTVEEGTSLKLDPADLIPYSDYYQGKIFEYRILQQPTFGDIKSGISKVNRFTHKQLEAGNIQYVHDGSENSTDTIKLVAIARNKESVPFDLHIKIIQVNDEVPVIVTNTGLQMWAGGRSVIKNTDLMAQDYDTPSSHIVFVITSVLGGVVVIGNDIFNTPLTNFSQYQINEEQVYFLHDSNHQNGQINFYSTDGEHKTSVQVLHIVTNPVSLDLVRNEKLHVFPLTRKQILPEQLKYKCSDDDRDVIYQVTVHPQTGRILYEHQDNGSSTEVTEFTQNDINNGRILYEHTHPMVELKSNDSFFFDVKSKLANSLIDQIFNIEISVSSGGLVRFLPVNRLHLDEGEMSPIKLDLSKVLEYLETRAGIQNPELYIDTYHPTYGTIETLNEKKNSSRFTLSEFTNEQVYYHHDHSDTLEDKILLSVYLLQGNIFLCNLTIPVIVNPVNDHPFYLVTQSPQMSIIEGENRTITMKELLTEDEDTGPSNIVYDIISGPTLGALLKISDEGIAQDIITYGNQFTQADINEERIQYVHYGNPLSTTFYFKVSDGKFNPSLELFHLRVIPVVVEPGIERDIVYMQQGANLAYIGPKNFPVETNADKSRLIYNVTENPKSGVLLYDSRQTSRFSFDQLNSQKITYLQTDMTESHDNFKVSVYVPETSQGLLQNVEVKIIVEPVLKINGISIISGDKIRLTSTFVDENPTQLKLNRYNPKIIITRKPDHGKIKKIIRNSGDVEHQNDKDITFFTYKELKSGVIYFIARDLSTEVTSVNDYFEYSLLVKTVQPGQGFVPIEIHRTNKRNPNNDGNDVDMATYNGQFQINYMFILFTLAGMVVLVLILILFIRCHTSSRKNNLDKDFPPHLPRPPDFLPVNNNRLYAASEADDSMPVTASSTPLPILSSIPHCKVIPIGGIEDSESDEMVDMNGDMSHQQMACYPYGDDNDEWSSSCDVANEVNYSTITQPQHQRMIARNQRANPLLRRNQYWV